MYIIWGENENKRRENERRVRERKGEREEGKERERVGETKHKSNDEREY